MTSKSTTICAELLLEYQSGIVHDLRGDLNGLLLTVDFLRRQLGTRPEVASLFGETLGDMDHVRGSLNRTLNQLDMVGQARRTVGQQPPTDIAPQNLSDMVAEVLAQQMSERARRRRIELTPPPASDVAVRTDPVMLLLAVQRATFGMVELARDTAISFRIEVNASAHEPRAALRSRYASPQPAAAEAFNRLDEPRKDGEGKPSPVAALRLARCLADMMGGSFQYLPDDNESCLELPLASRGSTADVAASDLMS